MCPKCRKVMHADAKLKAKSGSVKDSAAIYVVEKSVEDHAHITRNCPKCRNPAAFHWFSTVSGEHAGIRRERTVEHFQCTKCSYSWSRSS